jgi:DNA polymerase
MFIGEGRVSMKTNRVVHSSAQAGKFLEEALASIGLKREQVFITNVVKCRPRGITIPRLWKWKPAPGNIWSRSAINPRVIVTLGRYSMGYFLPNAKISNVHGQSMQVLRATDRAHVSPGCCSASGFAQTRGGERFRQITTTDCQGWRSAKVS